MSELTPFSFVKSINETKENLLEENPDNIKQYNPYLVNKSLSFLPDTIYYANIVNQLHYLDPEMQYGYLLHDVPKKKRYAKWQNHPKNEDLAPLMEYFKCNFRRAAEISRIINNEDMEKIKQIMSKGGDE